MRVFGSRSCTRAAIWALKPIGPFWVKPNDVIVRPFSREEPPVVIMVRHNSYDHVILLRDVLVVQLGAFDSLAQSYGLPIYYGTRFYTKSSVLALTQTLHAVLSNHSRTDYICMYQLMPIYRLDKEETSKEGEGDLGDTNNALLLDVSLGLSSVRPDRETSEADGAGDVDVSERDLSPAVEDAVNLLVGHLTNESSVSSPHDSQGSEGLNSTLEEGEEQSDGRVPLIEGDVGDVELLGQLVLALAALKSLVFQESNSSSGVNGGGDGKGGGKQSVASNSSSKLVEGRLLDESLDGVAESGHCVMCVCVCVCVFFSCLEGVGIVLGDLSHGIEVGRG